MSYNYEEQLEAWYQHTGERPMREDTRKFLDWHKQKCDACTETAPCPEYFGLLLWKIREDKTGGPPMTRRVQ